jgi:hypothetical protein
MSLDGGVIASSQAHPPPFLMVKIWSVQGEGMEVWLVR